MANNDVYAVTVVATQFGTERLNTFHIRLTDAAEPNATEFATLAVDFKEIHRPLQHSSVNYTAWRARQVRGSSVIWPDAGNDCTPQGGSYFEGAFTSNQLGNQTGDALPPQCALVTTLRTQEVGRRKRGRVYSYGMAELHQADGAWTSALLSSYATAWSTFTTKYAPPIAPIHFQLGVWSFATASGCVQNPNGRGHLRVTTSNPGGAFTNVSSVLTRGVVHTQRRRVTGVGR